LILLLFEKHIFIYPIGSFFLLQLMETVRGFKIQLSYNILEAEENSVFLIRLNMY